MDKENDIFEQPSKIQNMNYLFDEEDEQPAQTPQERPARQNTSSEPQRQRASQSDELQSEFATPYEHGQRRSSRRNSGSNQGQASRPRQAQASRPRQAQASRPRQAQASQPRQSQGSKPRQTQGRRVRPEDGQPRQAQPRQAQPRQAQPRQAQPRQAQPRQAQANSSRSRSGASNASRSRDYDDRRRVSRAPQRGGGGSKRRVKRSSGFKKFILIYSAILVVILIVGTIIFSSFLSNLEKNQPSNIAAEIAENMSAEKASAYLESNKDLINSFGDPSEMIAQFTQNLAGVDQVSYIENKDYRADAPSYNITANGETIAKVTLENAGAGSFGLSKWKVASIDIADYMNTNSFEILAPVGTTVKINDVELDESYLTGTESVPETLIQAAKYVKIPSYLTYKVAGVPGTPEVTAKDAAGNDLALTVTDDTYVVGSATSKEFIDSVDPLVNQALDAWGRHFINMGGSLSAYMIEGSDWYTYIFGGPDMDPIMTSFYEYESIANYEFTEKSTSNYIKYTDDCFTVDVHYKMRVDFNTDQMSDNNQQLDATWTFITQNGGQDWYIVDCVYKK